MCVCATVHGAMADGLPLLPDYNLGKSCSSLDRCRGCLGSYMRHEDGTAASVAHMNTLHMSLVAYCNAQLRLQASQLSDRFCMHFTRQRVAHLASNSAKYLEHKPEVERSERCCAARHLHGPMQSNSARWLGSCPARPYAQWSIYARKDESRKLKNMRG